jgi:hypothetical protein
MRAFTTADVVQSNPGTVTLTSPISVTVPNPTVEGNAGLVVMAAQTLISPPDEWHPAATAGVGGVSVAVMLRADLPSAGESSWSFAASAGSPSWCWLAEEWTNISSVPVQSSAGADGVGADTSLGTGNTSSPFDTQFLMGLAALQISSSGGSAWPTVAWSNGFVETDVVSIGVGSANGDLQLRVARYYGTDSEAGPWSTTATFTGSMTSKTPHICLAVLRAEDTMDAPASTIIAS